MTRTTATNFGGALQFPYATAATDVFHKEDVQTLAQAVDQHDHSTGKGLGVVAANASITNAQLGPDVARANLLANPGLEVWQRGNGPFAVSVSGSGTADRWFSQFTGAAGPSITVTRETTNVDNSPTALKCVVVGASATQSTGVAQPVEVGPIKSRQVTFSARVRCDTGTLTGYLMTYDGTFTYTAMALTTAYQTFSVTWTPSGAGTTYYFGVVLQSAGTFYLDNAMLVPGSQAANYVPLHPADDLARCLRYYETGLTNPLTVSSYVDATARTFYFNIPYVARKPVAATVTKVGTWNVTGFAQPTVAGSNLEGAVLQALSNSGAIQIATMSANASAGITVESNP